MNEVITILIKSSISIALLYLIYIIFLKKDTFFRTNRFYLVSTMLISFIIPFIDFSPLIRTGGFTYAVLLDPIIITADGVQASLSNNPGIYQILLAIYLTGVSIFTLRFIYQIVQLYILVRRFGISNKAGMRIVFTDKNFSPFSFFNLIFLNHTDIESADARKIIAHEKIHIKQWHSADLILLEFITIIQWFNPFIWLYRHAIKTLHEFLADEGVLHSGVDLNVYGALLFEQSTGIQINDLTNNFSKSLLKRRFKMMNKKKTTQFARLKLLLVLPLAVSMMLVISFSPDVIAQQDKQTVPPPSPKTVKTADQPIAISPQLQDEEEIFKVVEVMPTYKGGTSAMYSYLRKNIKYPDKARQNGTSGTVYVSFIVKKDGSVSGVGIIEGGSVGDGCDEEAMRVIKEMPKWNPGKDKGKPVNVAFNLPIKFSLDKKKEEKK